VSPGLKNEEVGGKLKKIKFWIPKLFGLSEQTLVLNHFSD
jgi:hypothetical protein